MAVVRHPELAGIACGYRTGLQKLGAGSAHLLGCGSTPLPAAIYRNIGYIVTALRPEDYPHTQHSYRLGRLTHRLLLR